MNELLNLDSLLQTAITTHQSGDLKQAEHLYQRLLEQQPECSAAWINLGQLQRKQGNNAEAMLSYQQAMKLPNPPIELNFNVGNLHLAQGDCEKALGEYQQVLRQHPEHHAALYQKGMALRLLGRV